MPNLAFSNPTPKVGLDGLYMIMFLNQSAVMQVLIKIRSRILCIHQLIMNGEPSKKEPIERQNDRCSLFVVIAIHAFYYPHTDIISRTKPYSKPRGQEEHPTGNYAIRTHTLFCFVQVFGT